MHYILMIRNHNQVFIFEHKLQYEFVRSYIYNSIYILWYMWYVYMGVYIYMLYIHLTTFTCSEIYIKALK